MRTSDKGIELIKKYEALRLNAYLDPVGIPTIGYGHTKGVKLGQVIDLEKAVLFLKDDLCDVENAINKYRLNINQNQFDALASFVFNVGSGNFGNSTLLKKIRRNPNDPDIASEFLKWKNGRVNGKLTPLPGLIKRRMDESKLYFS